jgi:diadenosine tetraphosphate (Ap4A) HIT family hydrolase
MFELDARLENDTILLATWPLSDLRLMNDVQFPWLILVPRVAKITEIYQLDKAQREQLDAESVLLGESLMAIYQGDKLNVAALGNVVSQLHIHHIVRFERDLAWPAPVWGKFPVKPYSESELAQQRSKLAALIGHTW